MDDAVGVISDPFSIDDLVVGGLAAVSAGVEESGDDVLFGTGRVILVPDALGAGTAVFGAGTAVFAAGTAVFGAGTAVLEAGRFHTDIAVSVCNILSDQLFRRPVCRSPLIRVVMGSHKRSGGAVDFHDAGDVVWGGVGVLSWSVLSSGILSLGVLSLLVAMLKILLQCQQTLGIFLCSPSISNPQLNVI